MSTELDYTRELVSSAIHAPDYVHDVLTLGYALTYKTDDLHTAPRFLFLGEKGSGKSTGLTVGSYLCANPEPVTGILAMTAPSFVAAFRMNPHATFFLDEANHLFGEAGQNGKHNKFYTYLNSGYLRSTAYAQFQENKVPMRIPIFGIAFLAGLGLACPPDMRDRAIVIRMGKAPDSAVVADFSAKETRDAFAYGGRVLKSWAVRAPKINLADVRGIHPKLTHRTMDKWGALFSLAQHAGGDWPGRIMTAFERLELDASLPVYAPEDQLLLDYLAYCKTEAKPDAEGIASGGFAAYANSRDHGAYLHMKPGQFRQFAVGILGPTVPFYDADKAAMVRGWNSVVHQMNLSRARAREEELKITSEAPQGADEWGEDF